MLLAQTNAQAIQAAAERDGEPVWFAGGLTAYRVKRIEDAYLLSRHLWNKVSDYEMRHFRSLNGLEAYARETQSVELMAICGFVRTYGDEVPRMMEDLRQRAVDRVEDARFWVSTAHKAKGLEFPHVALGGFFDWEEYVAQRERRFTREMVEDLNLLYVAATRADRATWSDLYASFSAPDTTFITAVVRISDPYGRVRGVLGAPDLPGQRREPAGAGGG